MHRPVNTTMMVPASVNTMPMAASPSVVVSSPESSTPAVVQSPKESSDAGANKSSPSPDPVNKKDCDDGGDDDKNETTAEDTSSNSKNDDLSNMTSRREQIRAKLRASEKRLLSFTSTSSSDGGFLTQMATVQADLKKIEEQKSQLEVELQKLKCVTDNDDFLKEKMMGIKQGFDKQVEKIQSLQDEVQCKEDEIDRLHEELVRKIRRIVELEFDLETHEVHYTNYSAEQFKLGEEALEEIRRGRERERACASAGTASSSSSRNLGGYTGDNDYLSASACSSSPMGSRKAQQLITKLLADLEDVEERYKYDKLDYATQLQKAHILNDQLRTRIEVLENELASGNSYHHNTKGHDDETDGGQSVATGASTAAAVSVAPSATTALDHVIPGCDTNQFLRKRAKILEAQRALACKDIERMYAEFRALKKTVMSEKEDHKTQVKGLRTENEALKARIAELEAPPTDKVKKRRSILGKMRLSRDGTPHSEQHYEEIEQRIQEAFNKICRLEAERDIKDRQIATLKHEVSSLRMKDIANGKLEDTEFSEIDTEILRSPASRRVTYDGECDTRSSMTEMSGDSHHSYVVDLQLQLQEARQLLVRKDQELVIEQAKAASTAAGLLTRITELSGTKVDSRSGKQQIPN